MMTRAERKAAKRKAWLATPPGHIAKPLRHIGNRTNMRRADGTIVMSPQYEQAFRAAKAGNGLFVQTMARSLP